MGDQETFKAAVWYNGKIVNQDGNNPRYAGGTVKYIDVDPNTTVEVFLATVRDIFGIPGAAPITVKYHIFFSSEISKLLDVSTPCESLKLMLQPGLMLHPFYVEESVVEDGTDTKPKRSARKTKAIQSSPTGVEICRRSARISKATQSPPAEVEIPVKPSARVHADGSLNHDQAPVQNPIPTRQSNKRSTSDLDDPVNAVTVGDRLGGTSSANSSRMRILIQSLTGLLTTLDVEGTESVRSLKERILGTKGIAVEVQRLMYGGKRLCDYDTLADHGIADGSNIYILPFLKRIPTRHSNKRSASDRDDPVNAVMTGDSVGRTSSVNSSKMRIIIKSLCGLEKPLDVERTESVRSLKERILKIEGTAVEDQRLMYDAQGLLDYDDTLEDHGIADGSVIYILQCLKGC